jgi:hypothetical protein
LEDGAVSRGQLIGQNASDSPGSRELFQNSLVAFSELNPYPAA